MAWPVVMLCALYAALNVIGSGLIKHELTLSHALNGARDYVGFLIRPRVIGGFMVIGVASLPMFKALSLARYSAVIPVAAGINFILTACLAYVAFAERQSWQSIAGFAMILAGIALLSAQR